MAGAPIGLGLRFEVVKTTGAPEGLGLGLGLPLPMIHTIRLEGGKPSPSTVYHKSHESKTCIDMVTVSSHSGARGNSSPPPLEIGVVWEMADD